MRPKWFPCSLSIRLCQNKKLKNSNNSCRRTNTMIDLHVIYDILFSRSLNGLILFLIIFAATYGLKRRSVFWNYSLWSLFFIRLVFPPVIIHLLSIQRLFEDLLRMVLPGNQSVYVQAPVSFSSSGIGLNHSASLFSFTGAITALWLAGVIILLAHYFYQRRVWRLHAASAPSVRQTAVLSLVEYWRTEFKVRRRIRVRVSEQVHSPFTMGVFRPVIVLPRSGLSAKNSLKSIVAHECAHIKRLDDLQITGQTLIQILFFFHPAVWVAAHKLNNARECMCDSRVLAQNVISRQTYGQGLITWLKTADSIQPKAVLLFGGQKSALLKRIQNIKEKQMTFTWKQLLMLALIAIVVLPAAARNHQDTGKFVTPLPSGSYRISAGFGPMTDPFTGQERMHKGIDLAAPKGTPVLAVHAGVVTKAVSKVEVGKGNGRFIVIKHSDGLTSRYTQLSKVLVQVGEQVDPGDRIGLVGSSGRSTGPHLHFEIRDGDERVNPEKYITF
ncbi:MAG: M23/M56 family metallopeptidase [candidate division KSB1 bacterium]|nr:M23/M56 family metallopeptidase [candidate division KSB1 bacterium]